MAKKLKCIGKYTNGPAGLAYTVGQEFTPDPKEYAFLMTDAPGCFEVVEEPVKKAVQKPAINKAVQKPGKDK